MRVRGIIFIFALLISLLPGGGYAAPLVQVEAHPDRVNVSGDGKMHFTLVQGDYKNNGARAMMRETVPSVLDTNGWVYYRFGVEVDPDWPVYKNIDALIVQWRNGYGGPYFAIHLQGDTFYVRRASRPVAKYFSKVKRDVRNEFVVKAKWSEMSDGRLVVSINGETILNYKGRTLNKNSKKPYVSFGLYRPQWNKKRFDPKNKISITFSYFDFGVLEN